MDDEDMDEQEQAWIPPLNQRIREELQQGLLKTTAPDTIMATQGQTHIRAKQLQNTLDGGRLDS